MEKRKIRTMLPALALGLCLVSSDVTAATDGGCVWLANRPVGISALSSAVKKSRVVPVSPSVMAQTRALAPENVEVVLGEDFSKFTAGSEESPDMSNILNSEGVIMQDYINTYGWSGINIYQAGGSCFLSDGVQALLMTPVLDLSGDNGNFTVTVTFRAQSGSGKFFILGQTEGLSNPYGGYVACDGTWKTATINMDKGGANTAIQFYGDCPVFIDDIEISQTGGSVAEPEALSTPYALPATDITSTGFTANWQPVQNATAYLLDVFYFVDNKPQYVEKDFQTTETSRTLTGLEPGRLYYYSVQATDGTDVTAESDIIPAKEAVESLDAPVASAATEVSDNGFMANWSEVAGASYYDVTTLSEYIIPQTGTFVLDDETFDKVTTGTISSPEYCPLQCDLNDYTTYPDWYGITTLLADDMIGLKNYYAVMGAYSMLYSPIYQTDDANPADVNVRISAQMVNCTHGTQLGVALVDAITGDIVGGKWSFVDLNDQMTDYEFNLGASNSYYVAIGFSDPNDVYGSTGMVFIDGVKITQNMTAGTTLMRIYSDDIAYNNGFYVSTPDKRDGESFSYYVTAGSNGAEGDVVSEASDIIEVGKSTSVGNAVAAHGIAISASRGEVKVVTDTVADVNVYDMAGRTVSRVCGVSGTVTVSLAPGVYIVKCGDVVRKVMVR